MCSWIFNCLLCSRMNEWIIIAAKMHRNAFGNLFFSWTFFYEILRRLTGLIFVIIEIESAFQLLPPARLFASLHNPSLQYSMSHKNHHSSATDGNVIHFLVDLLLPVQSCKLTFQGKAQWWLLQQKKPSA